MFALVDGLEDGGPVSLDRTGKVSAGRGHRHVRSERREQAGGARAHQKGAVRGAHDPAAATPVPEGVGQQGHAGSDLCRPERHGRAVRGRRRQAPGRDDQVDRLLGVVLRKRPVPVRQVQTVLQSVPDHVRVHARRASGRQQQRDRHRLQVSISPCSRCTTPGRSGSSPPAQT